MKPNLVPYFLPFHQFQKFDFGDESFLFINRPFKPFNCLKDPYLNKKKSLKNVSEFIILGRIVNERKCIKLILRNSRGR